MRGKDQVRPLPELGNTLPPPLTSISMVLPPTPSPAQLNQTLPRKVFLEFKSIIVASGFRNACFKMDEIKQWWTWTFRPYIPPGQFWREAQGRFFFFFLNIYLFIYLFIYGCVGSSFLCEGFL